MCQIYTLVIYYSEQIFYFISFYLKYISSRIDICFNREMNKLSEIHLEFNGKLEISDDKMFEISKMTY
jgi:hypothetical protein